MTGGERYLPGCALQLAVPHPIVGGSLQPMMHMHRAKRRHKQALLMQLHQQVQQYSGIQAAAVCNTKGAGRRQRRTQSQ